MRVLELEIPVLLHRKRLVKGAKGFNFDKIAGDKHPTLTFMNASFKQCNKSCNK